MAAVDTFSGKLFLFAQLFLSPHLQRTVMNVTVNETMGSN